MTAQAVPAVIVGHFAPAKWRLQRYSPLNDSAILVQGPGTPHRGFVCQSLGSSIPFVPEHHITPRQKPVEFWDTRMKVPSATTAAEIKRHKQMTGSTTSKIH
jgi:hypothetical protein